MGQARKRAGLFEIPAEEKGLQIAIEGDEAVSLTGDRMFLRQAVVGLFEFSAP